MPTYPAKYPPEVVPANWNALIDAVNGVTIEGVRCYPVSYIVRDNGGKFEAIDSTHNLDYGGTDDAGGADGDDAAEVSQAAIDAVIAAGGGTVRWIGVTDFDLSTTGLEVDVSSIDYTTSLPACGVTLSMEPSARFIYSGSDQAIKIKNTANYCQWINLDDVRIHFDSHPTYGIYVEKNGSNQGLIRSSWRNIVLDGANYYGTAGIYIPYTSMELLLYNCHVWTGQAAQNYNALYLAADHSRVIGGHYVGGTGGDIYASAAIKLYNCSNVMLFSVTPQSPYSIYIQNSYACAVWNSHFENTDGYCIAWESPNGSVYSHSFLDNYIVLNGTGVAFKPAGASNNYGPVRIEGMHDTRGTMASPCNVSSLQGVAHFQDAAETVVNKMFFVTNSVSFTAGTPVIFYAYFKTVNNPSNTVARVTPLYISNGNSQKGVWAVHDNSAVVGYELKMYFYPNTTFTGTLEGFVEILHEEPRG